MKYSGKNIINDVLEYLSLNAKEFSERIGLDRPQAIYDLREELGKIKALLKEHGIE